MSHKRTFNAAESAAPAPSDGEHHDDAGATPKRAVAELDETQRRAAELMEMCGPESTLPKWTLLSTNDADAWPTPDVVRVMAYQGLLHQILQRKIHTCVAQQRLLKMLELVLHAAPSVFLSMCDSDRRTLHRLVLKTFDKFGATVLDRCFSVLTIMHNMCGDSLPLTLCLAHVLGKVMAQYANGNLLEIAQLLLSLARGNKLLDLHEVCGEWVDVQLRHGDVESQHVLACVMLRFVAANLETLDEQQTDLIARLITQPDSRVMSISDRPQLLDDFCALAASVEPSARNSFDAILRSKHDPIKHLCREISVSRPYNATVWTVLNSIVTFADDAHIARLLAKDTDFVASLLSALRLYTLSSAPLQDLTLVSMTAQLVEKLEGSHHSMESLADLIFAALLRMSYEKPWQASSLEFTTLFSWLTKRCSDSFLLSASALRNSSDYVQLEARWSSLVTQAQLKGEDVAYVAVRCGEQLRRVHAS